MRETQAPDQVAIREQYLVDYLNEEFSKNTNIRIRVSEEEKERGVIVRSSSREYFFPFSWAHSTELFKQVRALVQLILG